LDEDAVEIVKILRDEEKRGKLYRDSNPCNKKSIFLDECDQKIEEQNKQLKKLNKEKSNILNVTSHELRTPIAAIKGYVQIILKQKLGEINDDQKKSLEVVLRNANRLDALVQDLLDISRLDLGRMKFIPEQTDITTIVKETVETMHVVTLEKQIQINTSLEDSLPYLIVDKERIKQVLVNLLTNAIKFSEYNSKIDLIIRKNNEDIFFEIKDYGRGIPKDHIANIFDSFYQVKPEDKKLGGVGLGLAISQGILIVHGGKIWVESTGEPGKGSKFIFTLPIHSVENVENRFNELDLFTTDN
jgi:signal transduction histidine kinase